MKDIINKNFIESMKKKLAYVKPIIEVNTIEIECALTAGSARVLATDENFDIYEDWVNENDVERTIDW